MSNPDPYGIQGLFDAATRVREAEEAAARAASQRSVNPHALRPDVPFKDQQAMADAMKDPRYAKDPEYRKQVAARALGGVQARTRYSR